MSKVKVAVVFPIYNGANTMKESLDCIAKQNFPGFKAIIVDNNSTDKTNEIAKDYCNSDSRFELVTNDTHLSAVDNFQYCMNIGRKAAKYFCLRACDDLSSLNYLSSLTAALDKDPEKLLAGPTVRRVQGEASRVLHPDKTIFGYTKSLSNGVVPRSLAFPAEWCYGLVRSEAGADILMRRWKEYPFAWCVASYAVAEFVMRDKAVWVEEAEYIFIEGSGSFDKYGSKSLVGKFLQRLSYTVGCYKVVRNIPDVSAITKIKLFRRLWRDSRIKTRYDLKEHFLRLVKVRN